MSDRKHEENEIFKVEKALCPEEQVVKLESFIKDMKDEIKQLKKIGKRKEKIEKLEREKKKIISKKLTKHHRHH
ncbi:MAG TPA: hypothetical protein VEB00_13750 [Clostridia bacterium]|nr:hypothetical protein [Clostridia bacterium]